MVGVAGLELLPTASSSGSPTERASDLSVDLDNRRAEVEPGDRVQYTVEIYNSGERAYPNARISQELPAALTPVDSRPAARESQTKVGWSATIPPGAGATFTMTGRIGQSQDEYPQVVTTGCVTAKPGGPPLACDSDTDALQLPARSSLGSVLLLGIAGAIGVVVLAVRHWPRRARQPVRPLPRLPRRPFRRARSPRPVYVASRDTLPMPVVLSASGRWSSTDPARGPPAG